MCMDVYNWDAMICVNNVTEPDHMSHFTKSICLGTSNLTTSAVAVVVVVVVVIICRSVVVQYSCHIPKVNGYANDKPRNNIH